MVWTFVVRAAVLVGVISSIAACGNASGGGDRLRVVATTTQAADLVRNVAGDRVQVAQILAPNADPHEYELRPQDVQAVADADLVVRSGGDADDWLSDAVKEAGSQHVLTLIDSVKTITGERHEVDPHWGQDPRNAALAVRAIGKHWRAWFPPERAGTASGSRGTSPGSGRSMRPSRRAGGACRRASASSSRRTTPSATTPSVTASR